MRLALRTILPFVLGATIAPAMAQVAASQEPAGARFTSRAAEISLGGRVQGLFSTTTADGAVPASWELRRARLELGVRANPVVSARLQPEFAGSQVVLRDAYVSFDVSPGMQVRVGNAFRPFSLIAQTSAVLIPPIERGARIRGAGPAPLDHHNLLVGLAYADRDVGIQLRGAPVGAPLGLNYGFGVFNGPAQAAAGDELSMQFAGRLSVALRRDLRLGGGWSRRDFALPALGDQPARIRAGDAWQLDLEYGGYAPGVHLLVEVATGEFNPFAGNAEQGARFDAAQLWAGYRTGPLGSAVTHLEPILRISHGDPDTGPGAAPAGAGGTLITPGFNLYFGPLNRIMVNYEVWRPTDGGTPEYSFKTLFQIAF